MKKIVYRSILQVLLISTSLFADIKQELKKTVTENSSFIQGDVAENLKNKYPLCDRFLKVLWLEGEGKEQRGLLQIEFIKKGKKETLSRVFVRVLKNGSIDGIYRFKSDTGTKEWRQIIADMKPSRVHSYEYNNTKIDIKNILSGHTTLAEHQSNVCIEAPKKDIALLIEHKRLDATYDNTLAIISQNVKNFRKDHLQHGAFSFDVNHDEHEDFIYHKTYPHLIYSVNGTYYESKKNYSMEKRIIDIVFPPENRHCLLHELDTEGRYLEDGDEYYYTDGTNIYYKMHNQVCNLTTLTQQKGK